MDMVAVGSTASLLGPLDYMFGETLRVTLVVAVFLALVVAVAARFNEWSPERAVRNWLWVTSLVTIWLFTQHSPYHGSGRVLELIPFADLDAARGSAHRRDLVLANVALFMPFGIAAAWRSIRFGRALVYALAISVGTEALQFVLGHGRVAQTLDVLLNTAGAVAGWLLAAAVLWYLRRLNEDGGAVGGDLVHYVGEHTGVETHREDRISA